ncbi:hypothetical protein GDO81_004294 [Engystomops pustulosus]|uniref:Uncharacterized protein n=1 Tax=Engystomops pustulosus TaxID=76066 RepID=A0AAV6ZX75_ENGPU|nr:hypothetical protein GDO81_004294 [Engystomops pustulosus]
MHATFHCHCVPNVKWPLLGTAMPTTLIATSSFPRLMDGSSHQWCNLNLPGTSYNVLFKVLVFSYRKDTSYVGHLLFYLQW